MDSKTLDSPIPRKVSLVEGSPNSNNITLKSGNPSSKTKQTETLSDVFYKEATSDVDSQSGDNLVGKDVTHEVTPTTSNFVTDSNSSIVSHNTVTTDLKNAPVLEEVNEVINDSEDLGINAEDIPVATVSTPVTQKLPEALLRCAYIQNDNSQTVIFWCEELTRWAFRCQHKIVLDMREGKRWVLQEIPFASQVNEPHVVLNLHRNNIFVKGVHGTYGLRLFHYTLRTRFQTLTNMKTTARRIASYVNQDCKARLIFDESRLFLYIKPCVWSNLIGKKASIDKLIRDTNQVLNDKMSSNPKFWDNNFELIKMFFFYKRLQPDIAELLNAPLENIDPSIPRTPELLSSVANRRGAIALNSAPQPSWYEMLDPEEEVFTNTTGDKNSSVEVKPDVRISSMDVSTIIAYGNVVVDSADIQQVQATDSI